MACRLSNLGLNRIAALYVIPEISMNEVQLAGEAAEGAITFVSWSSTSDNPLNQDFVER